jgi:hypothetical protein
VRSASALLHGRELPGAGIDGSGCPEAWVTPPSAARLRQGYGVRSHLLTVVRRIQLSVHAYGVLQGGDAVALQAGEEFALDAGDEGGAFVGEGGVELYQ